MRFALTVSVLLCAQGALFASRASAQTPPVPAPSAAPASGPFTPIFAYTGEAAANPSGGIRQGSAYAGQLLMGFDLDMVRLAGAKGGMLHFDVTNRHGSNLAADAIGNDTSVQEVYGGQDWHLATLSYEQRLFNGRLDIEAGRIPANTSFLHSTLYCVFQTNSSCGNPPLVFKDSNFTYYPVPSWGIVAKAFLNGLIYLHGGAYEVNPDLTRPSDDGFTFDSSHMTGIVAPAEIGYTTSFADDTRPRNYVLGGWYDESTYADPLSGSTQRGRSGAYARFDQLILRPSLASQRGLTLFGVGMANLSGRVIEDHYEEIGLVQQGTFAGRDADTLGFVIDDQHFTNLGLAAVRAARASEGAPVKIPTHETMMELAYGAHLSPALVVSPNLQYVLEPDQMAEPYRTQDIRNALVVGLKFTLDLMPLLHTEARAR